MPLVSCESMGGFSLAKANASERSWVAISALYRIVVSVGGWFRLLAFGHSPTAIVTVFRVVEFTGARSTDEPSRGFHPPDEHLSGEAALAADPGSRFRLEGVQATHATHYSMTFAAAANTASSDDADRR